MTLNKLHISIVMRNLSKMYLELRQRTWQRLCDRGMTAGPETWSNREWKFLEWPDLSCQHKLWQVRRVVCCSRWHPLSSFRMMTWPCPGPGGGHWWWHRCLSPAIVCCRRHAAPWCGQRRNQASQFLKHLFITKCKLWCKFLKPLLREN